MCYCFLLFLDRRGCIVMGLQSATCISLHVGIKELFVHVHFIKLAETEIGVERVC